MDEPSIPVTGSWLLRSLLDQGSRAWTVPIQRIPFRVGRRPGLDLTLPVASVSSEHAEIYRIGDDLYIRDLQSTNGTFVNRRRISEEAVRHGDVIHFADFEFRLEQVETTQVRRQQTTAVLGDLPLPEHFVRGTQELDQMLREEAVTCYFQPIVTVASGAVMGHEALGRGRHQGLPEEPTELFRIAGSIGLSIRLSRLFRRRALELVKGHPVVSHLFVNTHPLELGQADIIDSLSALREMAPDLMLAVEVHEAAIVDPKRIAEIRAPLSELRIGLAYDDFGAGQARLLELAEVPPEFLKFDARFVRGIADAPASKRRLLRSLVAMSRDLGARPLAEGVETQAEAEACAELGFELAQGYYYSKPMPLDQL
jgi:EAL domain-containing protein (putative c-di-GMP-specific phosphodiesterase class I)